MKSKGFTLIELLAVIVILAIIALIATPVVLNIIKSSKGSSIERSAELYIDQVKKEIIRYNMTHPGENFNPSICEVQGNGVKCDDSDKILPVEINGDKPADGSKIILSDGQVIGIKDFVIDSKNLTYEDGKFKEGTDKPICTAVTPATTGNVPTGNFNYGDEYECNVGDNYSNTFFVLENNTDTVSLIMKENYTDSYVPETLDWCTSGGTFSTCKNINSTGSDAPDGADYIGHIKSIFNKEGIKVSFPNTNQIATASKKAFNGIDEISNLPTWIYDYLSSTLHPSSGLVSGYWLSDSSSWHVNYLGSLTDTSADGSSYRGLRPVITLSKSLIN